MRALALVLVLAAVGEACQSCDTPNDMALPERPGKRQRSLSERIVERALLDIDPDPEVQGDVALALGEVTLAGHVPHLRLIVAGNYPILAKGAAKALVRVRMLREPTRRSAILQECIKAETNPLVKAECAAQAAPKTALTTPPDIAGLAKRLEDEDLDVRRAAAREVLALPDISTTNDERLQSALYHGLFDSDPRFRLLVSAVYLRRSIATDPFATDADD